MTDLSHRSILLVEDEPLLAMDVEACLTAARYRVVGPATTVTEALHLIRQERPDLALLDLNLGIEMANSLPDVLAAQRIPFIILSGHSRAKVPAPHRERPFLQKPYVATILLRTVHDTLNDARNWSLRQQVSHR